MKLGGETDKIIFIYFKPHSVIQNNLIYNILVCL